MLHSIFKMPFNTFCKYLPFELSSLSLVAPRSLMASAIATKVRLQATFEDELLFLESYRNESTDSLPLLGLEGWIPPGWNSPSLLSGILNSRKGISYPLTASQLSEIDSIVHTSLNSVPSNRSIRLQKCIYSFIVANVFPRTIVRLLNRRCAKYFSLSPIFHWTSIFKCLPSFHHRAQLLRTVSGSWLTHRRLGEPSRSCIFGCSSHRDELQHYCDCTPLWIAVSTNFFGFLAHMDVATLYGFGDPPNPVQLAGTVICCLTYHNLRHMDHVSSSVLASIIKSIISNDFCLFRMNSTYARRSLPSRVRRPPRPSPSLPSVPELRTPEGGNVGPVVDPSSLSSIGAIPSIQLSSTHASTSVSMHPRAGASSALLPNAPDGHSSPEVFRSSLPLDSSEFFPRNLLSLDAYSSF